MPQKNILLEIEFLVTREKMEEGKMSVGGGKASSLRFTLGLEDNKGPPA